MNQNIPHFARLRMKGLFRKTNLILKSLIKEQERFADVKITTKEYSDLLFISAPSIIIQQAFISAYTLFESELIGAISLDLTFKKDEDGLSKLKKNSNPLEKLKWYVSTQPHAIKDLEPHYTQLLFYTKMRNSHVHTIDGVMLSKSKEEQFWRFMSKLNGVRFNKQSLVQEGALDRLTYFNMGFVYDFGNAVDRFYKCWVETHLKSYGIETHKSEN